MAVSDCVFCDIIGGRLDAHVIYQDELVLAFLDTHPIRPGYRSFRTPRSRALMICLQ